MDGNVAQKKAMTREQVLERITTVDKVVKMALAKSPSLEDAAELRMLRGRLAKNITRLSESIGTEEVAGIRDEIGDDTRKLMEIVKRLDEKKAAPAEAAKAPALPNRVVKSVIQRVVAVKPAEKPPETAQKPADAQGLRHRAEEALAEGKSAVVKETTWEDRGIVFGTKDFKQVSSVMHKKERWKVVFNEGGTIMVRADKLGEAEINGGTATGTMPELDALRIAAEAVMLRGSAAVLQGLLRLRTQHGNAAGAAAQA